MTIRVGSELPNNHSKIRNRLSHSKIKGKQEVYLEIHVFLLLSSETIAQCLVSKAESLRYSVLQPELPGDDTI